jgi:hypothetical protein
MQPPDQWIRRVVYQGVKQKGCNASHISRCGAELREGVKQCLQSIVCIHGVHGDNFVVILQL